MNFSIIYGYRDRETSRIKRCLDSLSDQDNKDFQVIFVDYGSSEKYRSDIESLVRGYTFAEYVYSHTQGRVWSRSCALNTGVRLAKGEYIIFSDVDLIYPPDFIDFFSKNVSPETAYFNRVVWLPEIFDDWNNVFSYSKKFPSSGESGLGGCCVIHKTHLEEIRGYEEYYAFWGIEDRDLHHRLMLKGLKEKWVEKGVLSIYHQWHEKSYVNSAFLPERWWSDFNLYYEKNKNVLVRNDADWGKLIGKDDRGTLGDFETIKLDPYRFGTGNSLAQFLTELSDILEKKNAVAEITLYKRNPYYRKRKLGKLREGVFNAFSRFSLFFINRVKFTRAPYRQAVTSHVENRDFQFEPLLDVPYAVWNLYKTSEIITDYNLIEDDETLIIRII